MSLKTRNSGMEICRYCVVKVYATEKALSQISTFIGGTNRHVVASLIDIPAIVGNDLRYSESFRNMNNFTCNWLFMMHLTP